MAEGTVMAALMEPVPPPAPASVFRTALASNAVLWGLKNDGPPQRHVWNAERVDQSQQTLFKLTSATLPALAERKKKQDASIASSHTPSRASREGKEDKDALVTSEHSPRQTPERMSVQRMSVQRMSGQSMEETPEVPKEPRRQRYFDLLMKHHNKFVDRESKEAESTEAQRRLDAAQLAQRKKLLTEARDEARRRRSDSDSEEEEAAAEEGDFGPLTALDGAMKVELEIVVMDAPKQKKIRRKKIKEQRVREKRYREILLPNGELDYETDSAAYTPSSSSSSSYYSSSSSSSSSAWASLQHHQHRRRRSWSSSSAPSLSATQSSESTPRMDVQAELQALHEELGSSTESGESDGLDEFKDKDNPWEDPKMRWALGIGGTVLFVPDAERYGHAPSLPPPPPRSMLGLSKVRMKPRLPLDISNHRYRDEHPNVWAADPYQPSRDDRKTFEQKLLTLDFYSSCSRSLTRLPPIERDKDAGKHEVALGHLVEHDAHKSSSAWKYWTEKERRRKEREVQKRAAAEVTGASLEASTAEPSSSLVGDSQFLQEPTASLEAGPSLLSAGSLGMPSEAWGARGHLRR